MRMSAQPVKSIGMLSVIIRLFRGLRRMVHAALLRALCFSLALHCGLLGIRFAHDLPADVRERVVPGLQLSATLTAVSSDAAKAEQAGRVAEDDESLPPLASETPRLPADERRSALLSPELAPPPSSPIDDKVRYFRRSELSSFPVLQGETLIDFPDVITNGERAGGKVVVRLFVSASGGLDRALIVSSALSAAGEEALLAALASLHFRPGELDSVAVGSQLDFEIDFDSLFPGDSRASDGARWWAAGRSSPIGRGDRAELPGWASDAERPRVR